MTGRLDLPPGPFHAALQAAHDLVVATGWSLEAVETHAHLMRQIGTATAHSFHAPAPPPSVVEAMARQERPEGWAFIVAGPERTPLAGIDLEGQIYLWATPGVVVSGMADAFVTVLREMNR